MTTQPCANLSLNLLVDETGFDEPIVNKMAVDEIVIDEPGPNHMALVEATWWLPNCFFGNAEFVGIAMYSLGS